jgi:hypothetical protein
MKLLIQKKVPELNTNEQEQLALMLKQYSPNVNDDYVSRLTKEDEGYDIAMIMEGAKIMGVNYYKLAKIKTPFYRKKIMVAYYGQAMKLKGYKGNIIWKIGMWYARKNLGWMFPFKRLVGISEIVNPRVYENYIKLFPNTVPNVDQNQNPVVLAFLKEYFSEYFNTEIKIGEDFCFDYPGFEDDDDITESWDKYFKAKNPAINELFIQKGIIKFKNNRVYTSSKTLAVCGYRNPFSIRKSLAIFLKK